MPKPDILIAGAGIIGCSLALRLAEEKVGVLVLDRGQPGEEASWAAAGMLAPTSEHAQAPAETELAAVSAALYPSWIEKLEGRIKEPLGYRSEGTLLVAFSVDEAAPLAGPPGERRYAPVRPVRGQMLALEAAPDFLRHVVRSPRGYLVPRGGGRLLVGSTMEDAGYDKSVTPSGLRGLLAAAVEIAPGAAGLPFVEAWAGLRPDTPDHLPILGATDIKNYFVATGHFRNGILLAPLTAELMTEAILNRKPRLALAPFSPLRLAETT